MLMNFESSVPPKANAFECNDDRAVRPVWLRRLETKDEVEELGALRFPRLRFRMPGARAARPTKPWGHRLWVWRENAMSVFVMSMNLAGRWVRGTGNRKVRDSQEAYVIIAAADIRSGQSLLTRFPPLVSLGLSGSCIDKNVRARYWNGYVVLPNLYPSSF